MAIPSAAFDAWTTAFPGLATIVPLPTTNVPGGGCGEEVLDDAGTRNWGGIIVLP